MKTLGRQILADIGKFLCAHTMLLEDHLGSIDSRLCPPLKPLFLEKRDQIANGQRNQQKDDRTENGGFANCFPGLRRWLDYPHVASIACPKPMLFINGSQDKLFPVAGVKKAFKIMHDTWESQGAGDKIETELWDMPHSCNKNSQKRVLDFFDKFLKTWTP